MRASRPCVLVWEYFSAGGRLRGHGSHRDDAAGTPPGSSPPTPEASGPDLSNEGRALLLALLADLSAIPGLEVRAAVDPGAAAVLPTDVVAVPTRTDPANSVHRVLRQDPDVWMWPVAPETGGELHRLVREGERHATGVVASAPGGIRSAALRYELLTSLQRSGVAVPPTARAPSIREAHRRATEVGWPVVVKPGRGAGGEGVTLVKGPGRLRDAWARASAVEPGLPPLIQARVEGTPASVSLLVESDGPRPIALNRQQVEFGPEARYRGGSTPLHHPLGGRAIELARTAIGLVGGLRGPVGVDLVLAPDGPVIVEVNPRLTTSYLGIRRHLGPGIAVRALRSCEFPVGALRGGPPLPGSPPVTAPRETAEWAEDQPLRAGTPGRLSDSNLPLGRPGDERPAVRFDAD